MTQVTGRNGFHYGMEGRTMFEKMCMVIGRLAGMVVGLGIVVLVRLTMLHGFLR